MGDVIASMKVADTGVIIINAAHGVEVGTEIIWEYMQAFKTPGIIVMNQMDHEKADFDKTLEQAQARFGQKFCLSNILTIREQDSTASLIP